MYILEKIKLDIVKKINNVLECDLVNSSDLVYPPRLDMGDLSLPLFGVAKKLCRNSAEVAEELCKKIDTHKIISSISTSGAYLNFKLNKKYFSENVLKDIKKYNIKYGKNERGMNKRVMIEYTNVNTHKEYHIGHIRNLCYGDAIQRIIAINGYKSIPVSYVNDFGIHVAKTLWAYLEFYEKDEVFRNKGYFLGEVYARASNEIEKDKNKKQFIQFLMKKIESRKGFEYELWKKTREWSIKQFDKIYKEMGVKLDFIFYESEVIERGKKIIFDLIDKEIFKKSQGAVVADLEKYGLGVLVILRSDGTATYPVADISLALEKKEKYRLDRSIYVVDFQQSLYFKQLFKILELIGEKKSLIHLGYEVVKLPNGKMSSRTGNVITYEYLMKEMFKMASIEIKKRHKNWSDKKIKEIAKKIAVGALKFEMIKVNFNSIILFDVKKAFNFRGYTSVYLQYSYARIKSVVRKYNDNLLNTDIFELTNVEYDDEYDLIFKISKYPEIVAQSCDKYDPSEIAKYLFELAQIFNDYYHNVPILKVKKEIREIRLLVILAIARVLENGLQLLGIDVIEEM